MDVESLAKQLILKGMTEEQQMAVLESIKSTMLQARTVQKQRVGENVQVVVQALKKLEADIKARYDETGKAIEKRVASIKDGKDGQNGINGKDGRDGRPGRDGAAGQKGNDGLPGRNGIDGVDGVSVTNAFIDFDGSLIINLSNGQDLNVGEVVAPDLAEKIKVITNGGGTSQQVLDTLISLQNQINNIVGGLDFQGTWNASTNTPTLASGVGVNGYYYITDTAGSTNLDGITDWQIGDWVLFNGTVWQKLDQSNLVTSVNGQTGAVSLTTTNINEGTNLYYTDVRARGAISAGTGISYDSATGVVTNAAPDQTVSLTASTGISASGSYPNFTIANTAPDQVVSLTGSGATTVTGTYPNFTIASAVGGSVTSVSGTGTVSGISLSGTVTTSGNLTLGGTLDLSSPPTIGNTAPNTGRFTTLTVDDNTTFGTSNTDTVTFTARVDSEFSPATDNTYDLGRVGHEWRNLYIDGTANIDSLIADTADINAGSIDGTTIGAASASTGAFTTLSTTGALTYGGVTLSNSVTGTGSMVLATSPTFVTPALGTPSSGTLTNCTFPTLNQNTTGNAATATTLQTARTIGGVSFNGSANINLPGVNTAGNQNTTGSAATLTTARTIGGVSFNGSANINLPGVNTAGNQNTTGNAATATALQNARTIGGVSFNGTANINLPGVNTAGNQNTTGTAANVTGTVAVANGGTGRTSLTANNVILGNGTSAVAFVAPSTSGNVLTSNGTTWTSAASPAATIASTAEAQAGTNNTNFITPLRMREGFNASGSAPVYAARAWVNFTGTGTVTINASGNVSSITDGGTGVYTVNFTTAMGDTNYAIVGTPSSGDTANIPGGLMQSTATGGADFTKTTSSITVRNARTSNGAAADAGTVNIAIFR